MKTKYLLYTSLAASLIFLNACQDCTPITVSYAEEEPYIDIEEVKVRLTYDIQNDKVYCERHPGAALFGTKPRLSARCFVTNTSEYDGHFRLYCTLRSGDNQEILLSKEQFIEAGRSSYISAEEEIMHYTFENVEIADSGIEPPTIKIKNEVKKVRTVTKYRQCNPCEEECK